MRITQTDVLYYGTIYVEMIFLSYKYTILLANMMKNIVCYTESSGPQNLQVLGVYIIVTFLYES